MFKRNDYISNGYKKNGFAFMTQQKMCFLVAAASAAPRSKWFNNKNTEIE